MGKDKTPVINIDLDKDLHDKQKVAWYYLNDEETTAVLYGGAAGGGKSYLGCLWIIVNALQYPETRYLIGRNKLTNLKNTTLVTFFKVCKDFNIRRNIHFKFNAQTNIIEFSNGSVVILKDLEYQPSDPLFSDLGGYELTRVFIDEANQIDAKCFDILLSRIRYGLTEHNLKPKILLSCNPDKNWVYRDFYLPYKEGTLEPWKKFVQALAKDNTHNPASYDQLLDKLNPIERLRLKYGSWEFEEQYNLINFTSIVGCFKFTNELDEVNEDDQYYLTVDPARLGKDHAVVLVWKGYNIIKIERYDKTRTNELQNVVLKYINLYKIPDTNIIIDTGGAGGGLADNLIENHNYRKIVEFIANNKPLDNENYTDLKTQLYYKISDLINGGKIRIYTDDFVLRDLIKRELETVIANAVDKDKKLSILNKEQQKKMLGRSPDLADAISFRAYFEYNVKKYSGLYSVASFKPRSRY
jgi:phage terminase large subunit